MGLDHHSFFFPWHQIFLLKKSVPRQFFILWLEVLERLPAQDKLLEYGTISSMSCVLQGQGQSSLLQ